MSWHSNDSYIFPKSRWHTLLSKFSERNPFEHSISMEMPRAHRSKKYFPTGSQYKGTWDLLGMSGYGVYTFPNGVNYEGEFDDGMFNGHGELRYPGGFIIHGKWKRGQLIHKTLIFGEGLVYDKTDWDYCKVPDRRFVAEYKYGVQPAGCSFITEEEPTRAVPPGYYDTGDGFYDPKTKYVFWPDDLTAVIRSPSPQEQRWIMENCRSSSNTPLKPRTNLYEEWLEPQLELKTPVPSGSTYTNFLRQSQVLQTPSKSSSLHENHRKSSIWWNPVLHYRDLDK